MLFIVENPANSFTWETSFFRHAVDTNFFTQIHACQYGSEHKKSAGFLSNFFIARLQREIDTEKAAEYPLQLSQAIAMSLLDQFRDDPRCSLEDSLTNYAPKGFTQLQPRKTRGSLLVSEYRVSIDCTSADQPPKVIPAETLAPWQGIPIGSKLLDLQPVESLNGEVGRLRAAVRKSSSRRCRICNTRLTCLCPWMSQALQQ